jgi:hypothetical protein
MNNKKDPSSENEWLNEVLDTPIEERFAAIADRRIGQAGQGHLEHQIDDYRLQLSWYENDQGVHCQAELSGPDGYLQSGQAVVDLQGCHQQLVEFIAEQFPDNS